MELEAIKGVQRGAGSGEVRRTGQEKEKRLKEELMNAT